MKQILLTVFLSTFALSGFYDSTDDAASKKSEYAENERLCKIFTKKVEDYKSTMRDDVLATATLASYEHRAVIFCKKAEEAKKSL
jgi:hypothetical protein